jgi:hypothetical protein
MPYDEAMALAVGERHGLLRRGASSDPLRDAERILNDLGATYDHDRAAAWRRELESPQ